MLSGHSKMKVIKGTPKHLSKTGQLDSFTYLMLLFRFSCNYFCMKCFSKGDFSPEYQQEISLEERFKLIGEAKSLGGKVVVLAGEGEPSLHGDIKTIVSQISYLDMIPIVYTNGSTLTPNLIEFYKDCRTVLVIAFDSLIPEEYDRLTGTRGQFEGVVRKIKNVIKSYKETIYTEDDLRVLSVAINTTVTSRNEAEVEKIKEFWGEEAYFVCNPLAKLGNAVENWDMLIKDEESIQRQGKLIEKVSESGGPLTLGSDGVCGYSRWGISVSPEGDYMACAYTRETNGLLGNINNLSLREAFQHKHELESLHYESNGAMPCLIRDSSFYSYLEMLKLEKDNLRCTSVGK